jgi:hypothetical protein
MYNIGWPMLYSTFPYYASEDVALYTQFCANWQTQQVHGMAWTNSTRFPPTEPEFKI